MFSRRTNTGLIASFVIGCSIVCGSGVFAEKATKPTPKPTAATAAPAAAKLEYQLKPGNTFRYRIVGIFRGNFPPFAQPGAPPANLKAVLEYIGTVKKVDSKGAEVAFEVDRADLSLLEKEPGPDGKIDPDSEIPFPIPTSQAQKTLNVSALIRPDGSVVNVTNSDTAPIRAELGIDLRKLFLLILPVTFPDHPVKVHEEWKHMDGVLGQKEGKIEYHNRLVSVTPEAKNLAYRIQHDAVSQIDDKKDKDGKLITNAENAVEMTVGRATVTGTMVFVAMPVGRAAFGPFQGRMQKGQLVLNANLKRTAPNPEKPEEKQVSDIEVKARLSVQAIPMVRKTGATKTALTPSTKDK